MNYINSDIVSTIKYILSTLRTTASIQDIILTHLLLTNCLPMIFGLLVAMINGIILNGKAKLKNTCVKINKSSIFVSLDPYNHKHRNTGITAITLVMILRTHGLSLIFKKPSITICPDNVPVIVEFWPEANNAIANSVLITAPPIAPPT